MDNSAIWSNIYDTSSFGNKYPSSYLVSLFHTRIKPMLLKMGKDLTDISVLDFGCSIGANSTVFSDLQMNTYGIDVSETAIEKLIKRGCGSPDHFKAVNLLDKELELESVFPRVKFDFVVASECMYYFTNDERRLLLEKFARAMNEGAILYVSMPTYDTSLYREYRDVPKNEYGMVEVKESGRIKDSLFVNLPKDIEEFKSMYRPFKTEDVLTVNNPMYSDNNMVEYHLIAVKI